MERYKSWINPNRAVLFLILLLYIVLWLLSPQEFIASDPWNYSKSAFALSQHLDFGTNQIFNHRLAVTLPVAFLYSIFGVNIITTNLWPLSAALMVVVVVWLALPDNRSKIVGAVLCLTSVPLFKSSVALFPDIIATAFMALSSFILFNRYRLIKNRRTWIFVPVTAVFLLFIAFLAKASAYWVLPLWVIAFIADMRNEETNTDILFLRFYPVVFVVGILIGVGYLVFCDYVWGEPLARFKSIQALTGHNLWSWDKASLWELIKRLTISPIRLFFNQYGPITLLMASVGLVIAPRSIKPWSYYTISCLLIFWFGTTSFTHYEPMPLFNRMTLPMLPGLYILAAFSISRLSLISEKPGWVNSFLPILFVLSLAGLPFANYLHSWRGKQMPEAAAMSILKEKVRSHPGKEYLLICSDVRSPDSLAFYFGYRYPNNLRVVYSGHLTSSMLQGDEKFLYVNRERSSFLKSAYGIRNYDKDIETLGLASVYQAGDVVLLRSQQQDLLDRLIQSHN